MSEFTEGQRVRVTEQYAKTINHNEAKHGPLDETDALGVVTGWTGTYVSVTLDTTKELEGHYLFFPEELELV